MNLEYPVSALDQDLILTYSFPIQVAISGTITTNPHTVEGMDHSPIIGSMVEEISGAINTATRDSATSETLSTQGEKSMSPTSVRLGRIPAPSMTSAWGYRESIHRMGGFKPMHNCASPWEVALLSRGAAGAALMLSFIKYTAGSIFAASTSHHLFGRGPPRS